MTTLSDFLLLPSLTAQTQCLLRAWEKLGERQHSPAAKSGEAKPKTEVALKEFINGIVKMPFFTSSQDGGAARHRVEFEKNTF